MPPTNDHASNDSKRILATGRGVNHRLTRRRVPLSCVACRVRKLKCNREKPCQNCIVRGESTAASCTYAQKAEKKLATQSDPRSDAEDMRKRLNRLESSILSMLSEKKTPMETPPSNGEIPALVESSDQAGGQKISHDTRSTHWDTVLSELGAMKETWSEENDKIEYTSTVESLTAKSHRPGLLSGLTAPPDRATIRASIPTREASDKLILQFFGSYNPAIPARYVLHKATFLKQTEFMIETLNLHSFSEHAEERDGDMNTCLLSGLMMRLALQQGYHRDPTHHPTISIFQGEMRRRIWSAVLKHELLFSVQLGLPKAIRYAEADTESPRNLYEEELYEEMTELPPSRSLDQDTEISYQVVKYQIMRSYGRVIEFLHVIAPQPYEEVLKIDLILLEAHSLVPPHLQLSSLTQMRHNSPSRVVEKYILDIFYHKAVCILHRKYWYTVPKDTRKDTWYYSRKTCVASAMTMLQHQETMHTACAPGGCLLPLKWYHFSITNHDFLLAAMIICLDIMNNLHENGESAPERLIPESAKLDLLNRSLAIWGEVVDDCRDAKRAVRILSAVLRKIAAKTRERDADPMSMNPAERAGKAPQAFSVSVLGANANAGPGMLRSNPFFTENFGLGFPGVGNVVQNESGSRSQGQSQTASLAYSNSHSQSSPVSDVLMQDGFLDEFAIPVDFNWDTWDQFMFSHLQGGGESENAYQEQEAESAYQPVGSVRRMGMPDFRYPYVAGYHLTN